MARALPQTCRMGSALCLDAAGERNGSGEEDEDDDDDDDEHVVNAQHVEGVDDDRR